jgi:hypothetical protein
MYTSIITNTFGSYYLTTFFTIPNDSIKFLMHFVLCKASFTKRLSVHTGMFATAYDISRLSCNTLPTFELESFNSGIRLLIGVTGEIFTYLEQPSIYLFNSRPSSARQYEFSNLNGGMVLSAIIVNNKSA